MTNKYILPAEWDSVDGILLAWPHKDTDWAYMLDEIIDCYIEMIRAITRHTSVVIIGPDTEVIRQAVVNAGMPDIRRIDIREVATNDTWIRDYGVITTKDNDSGRFTFNDFCFNGWGLKFAADLDNLVTSYLYKRRCFANGKYANRLNFVLEGGSIESDGIDTILTTSRCLLSPNRNGISDKRKAEAALCRYLGAKRVLWLDHGFLAGDDTDSHIDTLARFASPDTIMYVKCYDRTDQHYAELSAMERELNLMRRADGTPYKLVPLPLPDPVYDKDNGERLPATYANFLIIGEQAVIVPTYGQADKDAQAVHAIQEVFPHYCIECVDASALIRQHGSIHCATMQIPHGALRFLQLSTIQ